MIDVVIGFDREQGVYKVYEPTSDTLLVTSNLGDSFLKLSEFLQQSGMIEHDLLGSQNIRYHIDSETFIAMVESNVNLLKRLNQSPSGFMISGQKFGQTQNSASSKTKKGSGGFSKSSFVASYKKFGGYG